MGLGGCGDGKRVVAVVLVVAVAMVVAGMPLIVRLVRVLEAAWWWGTHPTGPCCPCGPAARCTTAAALSYRLGSASSIGGHRRAYVGEKGARRAGMAAGSSEVAASRSHDRRPRLWRRLVAAATRRVLSFCGGTEQ